MIREKSLNVKKKEKRKEKIGNILYFFLDKVQRLLIKKNSKGVRRD